MTRFSKIAAIVNPYSAGGRTGKQWPRIARTLQERLGVVTPRFTGRQGHAIRIARDLLSDGHDLIVAVGGDGTFNEVANGFIDEDKLARPNSCMGIVPAGTGGDFQRMLGLASPDGIERSIDLLATGQPTLIDVGKARFVSHQGVIQERYFINLASFGIGGFVAARSKNFLTPLGGKMAFLWATFVVLLTYRGKEVQLHVEGHRLAAAYQVTDICVGNGRYYGGGMHPCPTALMDDGIFEITVIEYMSMFRLLRDMSVLYSGNIYRHPKTHHLRGTRIEAKSNTPTFLQLDGEPLGRLPAEITILPRRLPVMAGKLAGV